MPSDLLEAVEIKEEINQNEDFYASQNYSDEYYNVDENYANQMAQTFTCPTCYKNFPTKYHLKKHRLAVHVKPRNMQVINSQKNKIEYILFSVFTPMLLAQQIRPTCRKLLGRKQC